MASPERKRVDKFMAWEKELAAEFVEKTLSETFNVLEGERYEAVLYDALSKRISDRYGKAFFWSIHLKRWPFSDKGIVQISVGVRSVI